MISVVPAFAGTTVADGTRRQKKDRLLGGLERMAVKESAKSGTIAGLVGHELQRGREA